MAEHFNTMILGACAIGQLPNRGHCKDSEALTRVYEDEAQQACQKILRCLDIRVLDGELIVPTCLRTPTLILPMGHFIQLYYNPVAQEQYALQFSSGGKGFLQPRGPFNSPSSQEDSGHSLITYGRWWMPTSTERS